MLKKILISYNQFNVQLKSIQECFKTEFGAMSELFEKTFERFDDTNSTIIRRVCLANVSVMGKMERINKKLDGMKESIKKELVLAKKQKGRSKKVVQVQKPPFMTSVRPSSSFNVHSRQSAPINHNYNTRHAINVKGIMEIEKNDTPMNSGDNINCMLENFINMPTQKYK